MVMVSREILAGQDVFVTISSAVVIPNQSSRMEGNHPIGSHFNPVTKSIRFRSMQLCVSYG